MSCLVIVALTAPSADQPRRNSHSGGGSSSLSIVLTSPMTALASTVLPSSSNAFSPSAVLIGATHPQRFAWPQHFAPGRLTRRVGCYTSAHQPPALVVRHSLCYPPRRRPPGISQRMKTTNAGGGALRVRSTSRSRRCLLHPPTHSVRLFLSYAREDFDAVSVRDDRLEALGLRPWMDKRDSARPAVARDHSPAGATIRPGAGLPVAAIGG